MLRAALSFVLVLASSAAHAGAILYATAATTGEITSYCIGPGGGLAIDPFERVPTGGRAPSRLVVLSSQPDPAMPPTQFLYVAQNDRVQVFQIGPRGGLTARGRIPARPVVDDPTSGLSNMNPHDIAIGEAPDGSGPVLYVPQRADNRLAAFPIDPATGLSTVPTVAPDGSPMSDAHGSSCILGPIPSEWEDVLAANGVLYSARSTSRGEVIVYKLNPDGNFADGILVVNEAVGANLNSMCTRRKGCTTGVACTSDANCVQPGQACGAGVCVDTSGPECSKDSDCPGQTCQSVGPCDQNNRVYQVSSADCTTPIDLVDSQGQVILNQAGNAVSKRAQIQPWAIRRRLNGVSTIILRDNVLYVSERFRKAISALEVCPNAFTPKCDPAGADSGAFFTGPDALVAEATAALEDTCPAGGFFSQPKRTKKGKCIDQFRQPRLAKHGGRTMSNIRYNALALAEGMPGAGATIIGAQFLDGRIDGYRLRDGDLLPNDPTSRTKDDFRTSPFHMWVYRPPDVNPEESAGVLYVGAGEANRVQAYRLDRNGVPRERAPFSQTTVLRNTFPNAVIVVDLPGQDCG